MPDKEDEDEDEEEDDDDDDEDVAKRLFRVLIRSIVAAGRRYSHGNANSSCE